MTEAKLRPVLACALISCGMLCAPLPAATSEPLSWGKVGVSIDQYRQDAIECGRAGYYLDVSDTEAAHVFKRATGELESNETDLSSSGNLPATGNPMDTPSYVSRIMGIVGRSAHIVEGTRSAERIREVATLMQGTVDVCLKSRGYVHFRLTEAQRKRLRHLHLGSPERHAYLFGLATDPEVLKAQAV